MTHEISKLSELLAHERKDSETMYIVCNTNNSQDFEYPVLENSETRDTLSQIPLYIDTSQEGAM